MSSCTRVLLAQLARHAHAGADSTIVDLGCGTGGPGLWLASRLGTKLVGMDCSKRAVEIATGRIEDWLPSERARFVVGEFVDTGLESDCFEAAISVDALPFADDPDAALAEARRILRHRGRLLFTTRDARPDSRRGRSFRPAWRSIVERNGFAFVRAIKREGVSELWRRIFELWLQHESDLRAELKDVTVDHMIAEAREAMPRLSEPRDWFLLIAERA